MGNVKVANIYIYIYIYTSTMTLAREADSARKTVN